MLVTYNLPPWLCMSKENIMLTLLIPGSKQSDNDIDIFLQPLIDDLKLLWDEVEIYDVVRKSNFNLRVVLMWTINDFSAYENLAGCTTKGNLDVMHVEKNVCESIIGTLLDINRKSKDGYIARKDLQDMNIRHDLHPVERESRVYLPPALNTLSKVEKQLFCKRLYELKVPDGYSSNILNCVSVEETKVMGLKSHDYHVLMQQLLPIVIRGMLPKGPRHSITRIVNSLIKFANV
ncbi:hypothetical protein IC575_016917 [Cucumis melo]